LTAMADRKCPGMAGRKTRQQRAIAALLTAGSLAKAAEHTGIAERTLRRWLSDDAAFRDAYRTAARGLFEAATDRLRAAADAAVTVLFDALQDESATVRLRAALGIWDAAAKVNLDDLVQRIEKLERGEHDTTVAGAGNAVGRATNGTSTATTAVH
jgi:hypothetical protein